MGRIILNRKIFNLQEEDQDKLYAEIQSIVGEKLEKEFVRIFRTREFKISDSHQVVTEAYVATEKTKLICVIADSYNFYAQNALLKVLEEPPARIDFILFGHNKNAFLPTILSRLIIEDHREKSQIENFDLDLKTFDLKDIYHFLKESKRNYSQEEIKQKIQSLLFDVYKAGIKLTDEDLRGFDRAIFANANYQRFEYIFLPLLLGLLNKRKK